MLLLHAGLFTRISIASRKYVYTTKAIHLLMQDSMCSPRHPACSLLSSKHSLLCTEQYFSLKPAYSLLSPLHAQWPRLGEGT